MLGLLRDLYKTQTAMSKNLLGASQEKITNPTGNAKRETRKDAS